MNSTTGIGNYIIHKLNIIVGKNGLPNGEPVQVMHNGVTESKIKIIDNREPVINFFNSHGNALSTISKNDAIKMLGNSRGKYGKKYEKHKQ